MVVWNPVTKKNERRHLVYGESDAVETAQILADLAEAWRYLLCERVPLTAVESWDAILTGVTIDRGSISFAPIRSNPSLSAELLSQAAGCCLSFADVTDRLEGDFASDEAFEQACAEEQQRYCDLLVPAFEVCRRGLAPEHPLRGRTFAYKAIASPEVKDPPILHTVLTV